MAHLAKITSASEFSVNRGRLERSEVFVGISKDVFRTLITAASAGTTVKLRYGVPGLVSTPTGEQKAVVLQLD